jgi:hypothetical protein
LTRKGSEVQTLYRAPSFARSEARDEGCRVEAQGVKTGRLDVVPAGYGEERHYFFMPIIKLNRINKGGTVFVNSDQIIYMEVEAKTTTVHMRNNLFSVEETLEAIAKQIEDMEADRIKRGIQESGLAPKA